MMNPNDINIDFLLGLGSSPDSIAPAGSSGVENSGPLFGEVLSEMLMSYPGGINRPVVDSESSEAAPFAKQFELMNNAETGKSGGLENTNAPAVPEDKSILPVVSPTRLAKMQQVSTIELPPTRGIPEVTSNLTAGLPNVTASTENRIASHVPMADGAPTVVDDNVSAFNNDLKAQLPTQALPMTNAAIKMNLAVRTNLEAGNYEVIESRQADGTVTLKLADPSTRDGFIQVQLPMERLSSEATGSISEQSTPQSSVKRVDLDAAPKQTTSVERLFAQLNLKQIEVSNTTADNDSANDRVAIKLSGVKNDGVDVQLKALLPQDELTALKVKSHQPAGVSTKVANNANVLRPGAVQGTLTNSDAIGEQSPASRRTAVAEPTQSIKQETTDAARPHRAGATVAQFFAPAPAPKIRNAGSQPRSSRMNIADGTRSAVTSSPQAAVPADSDQLLTTFGQSLKQSLTAANKIVNNVVRQTTSSFDISTFGGDSEQADPFASVEGMRETGKVLTGKLSQREVRFTLPDDLASKLKPNGQSVTIRIDPDHLGPARLSLKMYGDKLSARITVETVGIKAVVEQSLDRLTQQLIKSGIEVERIEVALDGRQSGDQLSERHPQWGRQARGMHFDEDILTESNEVSPVAPVSTVAPARVGAGGVNVLA